MTKLTRREFLIYLGVLFLVISGISGFLRRLKNPVPTDFGNGPYGGAKGAR